MASLCRGHSTGDYEVRVLVIASSASRSSTALAQTPAPNKRMQISPPKVIYSEPSEDRPDAARFSGSHG
jgi:hypothetical protein